MGLLTRIRNKKIIKDVLGTKRFNFQCENEFPDISIAEIAFLIKEIVGFKGDLKFNANKLEGTPRKLLDTTRLKNLGWQPQINLKEGIKSTYKWYLDNL